MSILTPGPGCAPQSLLKVRNHKNAKTIMSASCLAQKWLAFVHHAMAFVKPIGTWLGCIVGNAQKYYKQRP